MQKNPIVLVDDGRKSAGTIRQALESLGHQVETKDKPPGMEKKALGFKADAVEEDGTFEGYLAVFNNVDSWDDVILPGAFKKTLRERGKKAWPLLWQHDRTEPIGTFTATTDEKGLYIKGKLALDVQRAKEAHALMKMGALDGLSIGYIAIKRTFEENQEMQRTIRYLQEVALKEGSVVTFPANDLATVTGVKAEEAALGEVENALKDAGYTKETIAAALEAVRPILHKEDQPHRDDEPPKHSDPGAGNDKERLEPLLHSLATLTKAMQPAA